MNTDKSHLLISGHKYKPVWTKIGKDRFWETSNVELLGIVTQNKMKLGRHVSNLCSNANNRLIALTRRVK